MPVSLLLLATLMSIQGAVQTGPLKFKAILDVPYCTVEGKTLTLNEFVPEQAEKSIPAIVEIHGGWFMAGEPMGSIPDQLVKKGIALISIRYRLGDEGGFPQNIRDCRNAIRYVRKHADELHIDPDRIAVIGGSAGGHLSLMTAMVPEKFDDGGPTPELKGVSAKVCGAFAWIPVTDLIRFWNQGPDDRVVGANGAESFRPIADIVPNDARPHLRSLFHGASPQRPSGVELYRKMSPIEYARKTVPPLLICDGEKDPIVPGLEGKALYEKLKSVGANADYWMTPGGGHGYPQGAGFDQKLDQFLERIFNLSNPN